MTNGFFSWARPWLLAADRMDIFRGIGHRFTKEGSTWGLASFLSVLTVAVCVIAALWLFSLWAARGERWASKSPARLFWELSRLHHLSWREMSLILRIKSHLALPMAADVFVDPAHLEEVLQDQAWRHSHRRLSLLKQRLFE